MKQTAGVLLLLAAVGGCVATGTGTGTNGDRSPWAAAPQNGPRVVPGVQGPWGTPVPMIGPPAPFSTGMPLSENTPKADPSAHAGPKGTLVASAAPAGSSGVVQAGGTSDSNAPSGVVRAGGTAAPNAPSGVVQTQGTAMPPAMPGGALPPPGSISPPGVPPPPAMPAMRGMMPGMGGMPMAGMGMPGMGMPGMGMPGMMPGMGMPGMGMPGMGMPGMGMPGMGMPGMGMPGAPNGIMQVSCPPPGAVALAAGVGGPGGGPNCGPPKRTEVRFAGPAGMKVSWYSCGCDGRPTFAGNQIEAPGRYNFLQAAIYRLKLSDIPGRPGVDLYPTLEVVPANFKTEAFLAHSAVPVYFSEEDLDAVAAGNYLVKVIYLPFPQYADVATTGPDEVVSTRLEPGADPIAEACKRGSILLVIRVGNIDLEAPNTPPMDAPPPGAGGACAAVPPGALMGAPVARGPAMPGMVPAGMPVARPGAMLPNGGQLPAQPLAAPAGPALGAPDGQKPAGPVGQLPPGAPQVQPVWYKVPVSGSGR